MRKIKDWDVLDSMNTSNVQCPVCKWYTDFPIKDVVTGNDVCPSCADDILFMMTGCRFGDKSTCNPRQHPDCG